MSIPNPVLGRLPGSQLSLGGLLKKLRARGRLRSLVLEALAEQLVEDEARRAGLSVTKEELQFAADAYRRRHGLIAAADTHAWLSQQGMSVEDFKANLEQDLLGDKLRRHLTAARIEGHFTAHRAGYERLRLAQVCVARDDLAHELASQVREDGRDLDAIAGEYRIGLVRKEAYLRDLARPLAETVAPAQVSQLVGPLVTPQGFVLVLVEERQPAALDSATRQQIENELFSAWLLDRMREATIDLTSLGTD